MISPSYICQKPHSNLPTLLRNMLWGYLFTLISQVSTCPLWWVCISLSSTSVSKLVICCPSLDTLVCVSGIIATNGNTYTISTLHNTGYTQYQHYQGLTVLCSVIKFHKLIWAPLIHFTSAIGGQIEQSIPLSPQTAQGAHQSILSAPP